MTTEKEIWQGVLAKLEAYEPKVLIGHTYAMVYDGTECLCAIGVCLKPEELSELKALNNGFHLEEPIDRLICELEILPDYSEEEAAIFRTIQRYNDACVVAGGREGLEERYKKVVDYVRDKVAQLG